MAIARIFRSGNGQAIQLPKGFRLRGNMIEIFRRGDEIVLRENHASMRRAFYLLAGLPSEGIRRKRKDFPQKRRGL
jgi:antitoxin VapB